MQDESWVVDETVEAGAVAVGVVPIADAHLCADIADLYRVKSRMTIARLFRKYIELSFRTPTELLHDSKALQKLQAYGSLFSSGVERVSVLQASMSGQSHTKRRDALNEAADTALRRSRQAAEKVPPGVLKGFDLGGTLDGVVGVAPPGQERYFATVQLAGKSLAERSWLGKFKLLARMTGNAARDDALATIDQMVADLMYIPAAFQDVVGYQRNLAQTLCTIVDLCDGSFDSGSDEARESLAVFVPLIAAGRMPQTREALIERLLRQLSSSQPLDRHDPGREREAFRTVALRLRTPTGTFGGEPVLEALNQRALRLFGPDGAPPLDRVEKAQAQDAASHTAFLAGLAEGATNTQEFSAGSRIFREGEQGDCAYMVLSGSVEICTSYKGAQVMLARLGEGSIFGEMSLFNSMPRSASAVTTTGCRLRVIDKGEMDRRVETLDSFSRHWVSYLISRIADLSGRVAESGLGGQP
ncbi:MAG: cyclic nucleotide-binding domain-containing protein [Alphaproteobacteria bacterium]|nr:cyclic nucleotide-binding domain-containing protein [Alphaproteobacteria bacterium]